MAVGWPYESVGGDMNPLFMQGVIASSNAVWDGYLYKLGDEYNTITGGWRVNTATQNTGTTTKNATNLHMVSPSSPTAYFASFETTNKIDLTNINTIYVNWSGSMTSTGFVALTVSTSANEIGGGAGQWFLRQTGTFTNRTDSLNVSALTGLHYVQLRAQTGAVGQTATMDVSNVYTA